MENINVVNYKSNAIIKDIEKIEKLLKCIDNIYTDLCQNNSENAYKIFTKIMPQLNATIMELIRRIPEFKKYGVDLPEDVIISQLTNMVDAFEHRDTVMLADTIKYELTNTLEVYYEILQNLQNGEA